MRTSLLIYLIFGAIVGWLASVIVGSNNSQGLIGDVILGIIGSMAGGWIMDYFGKPGVTGFNLYSILVGVIGAIVFVIIGRALLKLVS